MKKHLHLRLLGLLLAMALLLQLPAIAVSDSTVPDSSTPSAEDTTEPGTTPEDPAPADGSQDDTGAPTDDQTDPAVETPAELPDTEPSDPAQEPAAPEESDTDKTDASALKDPAQETEEDDEDLGIEIPDTWAKEALYFAVKNGILYGDEDGNLLPEDPATRAEMAAILMRLVGATDALKQGTVSGVSLDQFTDVSSSAWYVSSLSLAVKFGTFSGITNTQFAPNQNITREQAFAVIGRLFGLNNGSAADFSSFSDASSVSSYAVPYVGALVRSGYVHGDNKNRLNPKASISRQELAQILYSMLSVSGKLCNTAAELPEAGNVLYRSEEPIPAGTTIQGDLILSCNTAANLSLENVTVTGRLVVVGKDNSTVTLTGCTVSNLVLLSQSNLSSDTSIANVTISGADGASFTGNATTLKISSNSTIQGTYETVTATGDSATAASGSQIGQLLLQGKGGVFHLNGNADSVTIDAKNVTLDGSGYAGKITVYAKGYSVTCDNGGITEDIDYGLTNTKVTLTTGAVASPKSPSVTITAKFSGVNGGRGSTDGTRKCILNWYVDGKLKKSTSYNLKEGSTSTFTQTYTFSRYMAKTSTIQAVLIYEDEQISNSTSVKLDNYPDSYYAISSVPCITNRIAPGDYTQFEKETFVEAKGYSSSTNYLVWINLYHTKVNVFYGSKGNWSLLKAFDCGIGALATPTPVGIYRMQTHEPYSRWSYGSWYVDSISRWNGAYAFHSRAKLTSNNAYFVNDLNVMVSHGCIRMNTEEARYLFNVPLGTTVVVY